MTGKDIVTTEKAERGFYPTPPNLADKLLEGIDWRYMQSVLEPSAGKGNIVGRIAWNWNSEWGDNLNYILNRRPRELDVDCVEIDPYLRSILQYEFGGQHEKEIIHRMGELDDKRVFDRQTYKYIEKPEDVLERKQLESARRSICGLSTHIVHDDFLSYETRKKYDLIVMNPPFSDGDAHLLKAIEMQSRYGGKIRCILNAETLLNPYTNRRKVLKQKLEELGADISFEESAFVDAERCTDVEIAIIKIDIPEPYHESEIYSRLRKAAKLDEEPEQDVTELTVVDFMQQIVTQFNVEIDAGLALIREYNAMKQYMLNSLDKDEKYKSCNISLIVGDIHRASCGSVPDVNHFIRLTRRKYWSALFHNKEFIGKLTTNLREKYQGMVDKMIDYDFTIFNIQQIAVEMNAEMAKGVEDTIVALFDKMTTMYTWYPEMEKNIHYYNGWKTNKAHKINSKVILPVNGMFSDYSWMKGAFNVRTAESTISDIEKVFEYLDGNMTAPVDLHGVLERACEAGQTRNIPCKFFDVTLYKKGTMHIKFRNQALVDRFNIYCGAHKNWLPPSYGRKTYTDMTAEEQTVVDEFNGDGSEGSGAASYEKVLQNRSYYLGEPVDRGLHLVCIE